MSHIMAENSIFMHSLIMYGEGFVLILLLTVVTFSYFIFERKHVTKLWNKCKCLISNYNKCKHPAQKSPRHISLLKINHWQYRGEGNEYLAISLPEQRKILRLRKTLRTPNGIIFYLKNWFIGVTDEMRAAYFEKLNLEYYKVLARFIGECYVQPSEEILLKQHEINNVNKIIASSRPDYRKKKDIGYSCGSLLIDYAYLPIEWDVMEFNGPTFAVEIKPKQGWIPEPERVYQLCTYCLNQYIKLQNGETSALSNYCPMDLFSGQKHRMNTAINSLLKIPQNNIKIFLEGGLIYGENNNQNLQEAIMNIFQETSIEKFTNEFCDLITNALLKQLYNSNNHTCTTSQLPSQEKYKTYEKLKHCDTSRVELPRGCVLERILNLQELDTWGAEKVYELLVRMPHKENNYHHASCVVARATKKSNCYCAKCFFHENDHLNIDSIVQMYIMSAIAKDCSLMLTFRRFNRNNVKNVNIPEQHFIETSLGCYAFNIGVFDLYPKPLSCISKHVRKRSKFTQIYRNITSQSI